MVHRDYYLVLDKKFPRKSDLVKRFQAFCEDKSDWDFINYDPKELIYIKDSERSTKASGKGIVIARIISQQVRSFQGGYTYYLKIKKTVVTEEAEIEEAINQLRQIKGLELIPKDG